MSTKEKMLGKESNNKKAHRRYSLLLLALLFIGFATYGTYAYFSNSTSTTKGNLTLNGMEKVTLGDSTANSGDGVLSSGDYQYNPDSSKKNLEEVTENYSQKFGEFNWYYVGNTGAQTLQTVTLSSSLSLSNFNTNVTSTDSKTFNGVNSGDVFRKTVRYKVNGGTNGNAVGSVKIEWGTGTITSELLPEGVSATMYSKIGTTTTIKDAQDKDVVVAPAFSADNFDTTSLTNAVVSKSYDKIKAGEYLDIELLVHVGETVKQPADLVLAKIAREITVTITQDNGIKTRTALTSEATNTSSQAN